MPAIRAMTLPSGSARDGVVVRVDLGERTFVLTRSCRLRRKSSLDRLAAAAITAGTAGHGVPAELVTLRHPRGTASSNRLEYRLEYRFDAEPQR